MKVSSILLVLVVGATCEFGLAGQLRNVEISVELADGNRKGVVYCNLDDSMRVRSLAMKAASEQYFGDLIPASSEKFWLLDKEGHAYNLDKTLSELGIGSSSKLRLKFQ